MEHIRDDVAEKFSDSTMLSAAILDRLETIDPLYERAKERLIDDLCILQELQPYCSQQFHDIFIAVGNDCWQLLNQKDQSASWSQNATMPA